MTDSIAPNKWVKTLSGQYGRVKDVNDLMVQIRVVRVLRHYRQGVSFTGDTMTVPRSGCKMTCKPGHIVE